MSEDEWHIKHGWKRLGPFSIAQLREMIERGEIGPDTKIRRSGSEWMRIDWIYALADALPKREPQPDGFLASLSVGLRIVILIPIIVAFAFVSSLDYVRVPPCWSLWVASFLVAWINLFGLAVEKLGVRWGPCLACTLVPGVNLLIMALFLLRPESVEAALRSHAGTAMLYNVLLVFVVWFFRKH